MTNRFINNIISSISRNGNGDKGSKEPKRAKLTEYVSRYRTGTGKENSCGIASKKGTGGFGVSGTSSSKEGSCGRKDCSRSLQSNKAFCVEGRKGKSDTKSLYWKAWQKTQGINFFLFFIFSDYRIIPIIQAIDDICYQINPILAGALLK